MDPVLADRIPGVAFGQFFLGNTVSCDSLGTRRRLLTSRLCGKGESPTEYHCTNNNLGPFPQKLSSVHLILAAEIRVKPPVLRFIRHDSHPFK